MEMILMNFSTNELEIIMTALKGEGRALRNIMNDLEHRKLHNGDQNMAIQTMARAYEDLYRKVEAEKLSD